MKTEKMSAKGGSASGGKLKQKIKKFSQGSVLVYSLVILFVMLSIVLAMSVVAIKDRDSAGTTGKSVQAFQAANSGSELFAKAIKNSPTNIADIANKSGGTLTCGVGGKLTGGTTASGGTYSITMLDSDGNALLCSGSNGNLPVSDVAKIKSIGTYGNAVRAIEAPVEVLSSFVYVADTANNRIVKFDSGSDGTTLGGNWQSFGSFGTGIGNFRTPKSLFADPINNKIFVVDSFNSRIVEFDSGSGGTTLGGNWQSFGSFGSSDGKFDNPIEIFVDAINNKVYVTDGGNNRIVRFDSGSGGTVLGANWRSFGSFGSGNGRFNFPTGVTVDIANNKVYIGDQYNNRIVKFDSGSGGTTLGGNWQSFGSLGSGSGNFHEPVKVFVDSTANKIYIADSGNDRIVKCDSGSGGTTLGGNWQSFGTSGSGSGQFNRPLEIIVDNSKNKAYITDNINDRIVKCDSGSGGTTLGGNWQSFGTSGSGGGQINSPGGISLISLEP